MSYRFLPEYMLLYGIFVEINIKWLKINLLPTRIKSFDVVFGIHHLEDNQSNIYVEINSVSINTSNGYKVYVYREKHHNMQILIVTVKARKYLLKGCPSYFVYVLNR